MKTKSQFMRLLGARRGVVLPDSYSTAWVARVPAVDNRHQPAWPEALAYIRAHQQDDGGWGAARIYNAHERTISTLACLSALTQWPDPDHAWRIERGVLALHQYASDLPSEAHETIGFELLLPRLIQELKPYGLSLPLAQWRRSLQAGQEKLRLIGELQIDYEQPRTWWFNMEMLPNDFLARVDERILNQFGAIETSTAATAAYLRARRQLGKDSPPAAAFLQRLVHRGGGGVGFCWPIELFELVWTLGSFWQAGINPNNSFAATLLRQLSRSWDASPQGLSYSAAFQVNDGDDTSMGYAVLRWGGLRPTVEPLLSFWDTDHFRTYHDERTASLSVNMHALLALRQDLQRREHKRLAVVTTEWLRRELQRNGEFSDKWHFSPYYVAAHAVSAFAGWDDDLARQAVNFLLAHQLPDGGWGITPSGTMEETAHAVLGLAVAQRMGLLRDPQPLAAAQRYFQRHQAGQPQERLWIGKTLYQPVGLVQMLMRAARSALTLSVNTAPQRYWLARHWLPAKAQRG